METISIEKVKELLLTKNLSLQPTQKRLCFPILQRIHHKMKLGVTFNSISVANGIIIEGHHRYICSVMLDKPISTNFWDTKPPVTTYEWSLIELDENDWETQPIIERHNAKDATRSGLDIKTLTL